MTYGLVVRGTESGALGRTRPSTLPLRGWRDCTVSAGSSLGAHRTGRAGSTGRAVAHCGGGEDGLARINDAIVVEVLDELDACGLRRGKPSDRAFLLRVGVELSTGERDRGDGGRAGRKPESKQ